MYFDFKFEPLLKHKYIARYLYNEYNISEHIKLMIIMVHQQHQFIHQHQMLQIHQQHQMPPITLHINQCHV